MHVSVHNVREISPVRRRKSERKTGQFRAHLAGQECDVSPIAPSLLSGSRLSDTTYQLHWICSHRGRVSTILDMSLASQVHSLAGRQAVQIWKVLAAEPAVQCIALNSNGRQRTKTLQLQVGCKIDWVNQRIQKTQVGRNPSRTHIRAHFPWLGNKQKYFYNLYPHSSKVTTGLKKWTLYNLKKRDNFNGKMILLIAQPEFQKTSL